MSHTKRVFMIISCILGIAFSIFFNLSSPVAVASYTGAITSNDYKVIKEYAMEVAQSYAEPRDDWIVQKKITEEAFIVTVDAPLYGVEVVYPLSESPITTIYEKIDLADKIQYDKVTCTEHTSVKSPVFYIVYSIGLAILVGYTIYLIIYELLFKTIIHVKKKSEVTLEK